MSSAAPIGVRTHAVIGGHWIAIAFAGALGLAALVFFFLPAWLAPSRSPAPPAPAVAREAPRKAPSPGDPAETVRQRLQAEEAALRYREKYDALKRQGAPDWAPEAWAAATASGADAAAAAGKLDYPRAVALYDEGVKRLAALSAEAMTAYERALAAGNAALEARIAGDAAKAFQLALAIRPEDGKAQHGLDRARRLDQVLAHLTAGEAHEKDGALSRARQEYAAANALDPEFTPARAALARLDGRRAADRFDALMTRGLEQLERSDWNGAEQTFAAALKLRPAHPAATDGLARAKQQQQQDALARLQREGRALEAAERWDEAAAAYRRAAAIDPAVDFAKEGLARSSRMIAVNARMAAYLAEPERLYSETVREEARQFLASLDSGPPAGPRLAQERRRLEAALKRATIRIEVRLASDNATDVTLYRVGPLGRFQSRQVSLMPGTYTLIGSRPGYKDVRVQLIVAPDADAPRVFIACEERV